tara:strand:- start:4430 stop:6313 length:1884 start_codon:yes stop_codon:yes gene_type:complete
MATTITPSDLNFDDIKTSLTNYFKSKSEFSDYDFEGSALSNIMDVLAYNTHLNGLLANFALNEAFLPTAQLRTSLVNQSLSFGYIPRSKTASRAQLTVSVNLSNAASRPATVTLPAGTAFTASVDGVSYTFRTLLEYTGYDTTGTGIYTFVDQLGNPYITVFEGELTVKTFIAEITGDRQVYVVPDQDLDLGTVGVQVYDDVNSDNFTTYFSANATTSGNIIATVSSTTALYLPLETYNGYWEFNFGVGGVTGVNPTNGQVIRITYLRTNGLDANGASVFTPSSTLSVNNVSYTLNAVTFAKSSFGADKEGTESIRINAPLSYLAQNRFVAAGDYLGIIANGVPGIKSINAWGGEDNVPAKYGKVLVSLVYEDTLTAAQKVATEAIIIQNLTNPLSVIGVETEFVDPTFIYLDVSTTFRYNAGLTNLTRQAIENKIRSFVQSYFATNAGKFNDVIHKSKVAAAIDGADPSILGTKLAINMKARFTPVVNATTGNFVRSDYTINFLNSIQAPQMDTPTITSEKFTFNNLQCTIRNAPLHSTTLQIIDGDANVIVGNVGNYEPTTGKVNLVGFLPQTIVSGNTYLQIKAIPADDTNFKPLRNTLIELGDNLVTGVPDIDAATSVTGVTN